MARLSPAWSSETTPSTPGRPQPVRPVRTRVQLDGDARCDRATPSPHRRPSPVIPDFIGWLSSTPSIRGTPPRVWGLRHGTLHFIGVPRYTPTRVGTSARRSRLCPRLAVHPHACGDFCTAIPALSAPRGTPPRVWGLRLSGSRAGRRLAVQLLDGHHFDRFVEGLCDRFYAPVMGRPSLAPGRSFRLLLVGYFEGIDSERGMAWRATDSLAVRRFLRLAVDEAPPDHSTIARTRRLIDLETHRTVFTWVQQRLVEAGRLTGKTIAIDATTLEANAAMRSIVRRDTGESDQAFLAGLATASGVETPTREGLARLDRKRKKKTSNTDWTHPHDPDATVTKMKDGRTHLAHKAEHAVDMETGAIVAVTRQGADVGDTTTIIETAIAATEQVEDAQANVDDRQSLEEIVGDTGYHSNQTLIDLDAGGIRSYVSEPDRGRRDWSKEPEARAPVYGNRRRMRGRRGRRLMRQRGERIERSFAHLYDTGGMRRTHLRGHTNILKRLLIHAGGFNLGLVMRHLIGIGTPRGLQGRVAAVLATLGVLMGVVRRRLTTISSSHRLIPAVRGRLASLATFAVNSSAAITCTTGC